MRMQGFVNLGWSPVLAVATTNGSNILQVVGWQGGFGSAPSVGLYVGSDGYKTNITDGVNIRGAAGAGASLRVSAGGSTNDVNTLAFADSNGIAFGLNGSTITASYNQSNQSLGWYAVGNTTQNSSTTFDARSISVNGVGGGISVGYSNGSLQLSVASPVAQTNQTIGLFALGNTTQNSSTTRDARSLSFNGLGGISVGFSNGSIQLSVAAPVAQTNQTMNWYAVGNTTQNSSTNFDARTVSLNAAGGGISVGYSNGSVQLSVASPVAQTNQSIGLYALGNTTQNSSTTLDARSLSFNGLGIITAGYSNGSIQISATQSNQNLSLFALGNTTQNSSTLLNASALSFNALGNGSIGYSNGSIQVSFGAGGAGGGTLNWFALGNTTQNSSTTLGTGAISLNGLGIVTVGYSNGSIQISATTAAQTNQSIGLYGLGNTTQNSSTTLDARSLSFNGLGIVTVGYSNGSIQLSATQSNQNLSLFAIGNTTQNSSTVLNANALSISGSGNITVGYSNGAIIIGQTGGGGQSNQTVGWYAIGNTTQNSSTTLDARSMSINGLGIVTVGYSNGSIQISATTAQSNQSIGLYAIGNTTQNSSTTLDARTISFNGLGGMTAGFSNGSVQLSVPAQSSLSATGGVSISVNGSTISIGAQSPVTLSRFNYPREVYSAIGNFQQGRMSLNMFYQPHNVTATIGKVAASIVSASIAGSTATQNMTLWMGIYTLNGSTLSLASSGSANNSFQVSSAGALSTNYVGIRELTVPININMTPGQYWMAAIISTNSVGTPVANTWSMMGDDRFHATAWLAPLGGNSTLGRQIFEMMGLYTGTQSSGPVSVNTNGVQFTGQGAPNNMNFYFQLANATY